jgi:hypothetical protein
VKPQLALACSVLGLAACASAPRPQPPPPAAVVERTTAGEACTPRDGALLADGSRECGTYGRVYSGDELRRTGAQNVGDALSLVDGGFIPR